MNRMLEISLSDLTLKEFSTSTRPRCRVKLYIQIWIQYDVERVNQS
jgi:hypothetical protein